MTMPVMSVVRSESGPLIHRATALIKAHQINLQRSLIGSEYRPIRGRGQPSWVCGRDRRLKGTNQLPKVIAGVRFNDGIEIIEAPENHAA